MSLIAAADAKVIEWFDSIDETSIYFSSITMMERRKGIEKLRISKPEQAREIEVEFERITMLFAERVLVIDGDVAQEWGRLLNEKEKHIMDTSIAATARKRNMIIVTRNTKDYKGRNVRVINPAKRPFTIQTI